MAAKASDPEDGNPPVDGPSDADLVARTLAGERAAFDVLIHRYHRRAIAVSCRMLDSSHDAMEVTQEAYLKAYNSLASLQNPAAFRGWLMTIVSNLSLNHRRGRKSRNVVPLDDLLDSSGGGGAGSAPNSGNPLRQLQSKELGKKLTEALAKLPEKQRMALLLFTYEELPQKDVAEQLECSVEAVKWHVFQARKKLKDILKDVI